MKNKKNNYRTRQIHENRKFFIGIGLEIILDYLVSGLFSGMNADFLAITLTKDKR